MTPTSPATPLHSSNAAAIASALWDSADFVGAARQYERALQEDANDLEALYGLGRLKVAQNELAAATLLLERAAQLAQALAAPTTRAEWLRRIHHELAWDLYRLDRFDLAAGYFEQLPGQEALVAQLRAFGERQPYRYAPGIERIDVPLMGSDPLLIVAVTLGGSEYPFVLDSGSGQLVIDQGLAERLALPDYGSRQVTFATGQRAAIGHTILPHLGLGDVTLREIPTEVMPVKRLAPQLAGFIGMDLLRRFHVEVDREALTLRLYPPHEAAPRWPEQHEVPFLLFDSHLLLAPAHCNGQPFMAYLATGMAGSAFTMPESLADPLALHVGESLEGVGAGGHHQLHTITAQEFCLGPYCQQQLPGLLGFFPPTLEWRYGFQVGALLGQSFLADRSWGLDFERMRLLIA